MTPELEQRLAQLEAKVDAIYTTTKKARKYILIVVWITVLAFVLPAIGIVFVVPSLINTYTTTLNGIM